MKYTVLLLSSIICSTALVAADPLQWLHDLPSGNFSRTVSIELSCHARSCGSSGPCLNQYPVETYRIKVSRTSGLGVGVSGSISPALPSLGARVQDDGSFKLSGVQQENGKYYVGAVLKGRILPSQVVVIDRLDSTSSVVVFGSSSTTDLTCVGPVQAKL